ncbi:hypothetical protein L6164_028378 [Bauhinia variegata]|uniref:Uncharacterized protein n=1 Tax=Bauhinia variegata TaxID=167791 RepID=A0ACB9LW60_BAUVA|nr:hypothetical protein L6164_028378 [Bauhinia variegata]
MVSYLSINLSELPELIFDHDTLVQVAGALLDVLHLHDVLARVSLARLCHTISRARVLDGGPDIRSQFNSVLYQLLLDPSERVCFEAILCVLGKYDNTERTEERAVGWYRLTREILKLPEVLGKEGSKDKCKKKKGSQPLIKLVMRRLETSFRSFSRPVLHAAARVVQEMGKVVLQLFLWGYRMLMKEYLSTHLLRLQNCMIQMKVHSLKAFEELHQYLMELVAKIQLQIYWLP